MPILPQAKAPRTYSVVRDPVQPDTYNVVESDTLRVVARCNAAGDALASAAAYAAAAVTQPS